MSTLTTPNLSTREFIPLLAFMTSLLAMSIDAVLPALPMIGQDLQVSGANHPQLVISTLFLGLGVAQLFFGPLSDSIGRKPTIYIGYVIFLLGTLLSIFATNFEFMLLGRLLQGIGMASPRVVSQALVRDQYEGREMAKIMSFSMAVFILVPVIAPAVGQAILMVSHWRMIFVILMVMAVIAWVWFAVRQAETLPRDKRSHFSLSVIWAGIKETCGYRTALGYTVLSGFVFGAFIAYLSTAPQIFSELYGITDHFPFYFAFLASAVGVASIINGWLVMKMGTRVLTLMALLGLSSSSLLFLIYALFFNGIPPLWHSMGYFFLAFMFIGLLFGNTNAMAMEPLGHIAGIGAAVIGSLSTLMSVLIGGYIGFMFDGTLLPLLAGFAGLSCASLVMMWWIEIQPCKNQPLDALV